MILTFPALLLAVFGYSAILEYKNKKANERRDSITRRSAKRGPKKQGAYSAAQAGEQYPKAPAASQTLIDQASR